MGGCPFLRFPRLSFPEPIQVNKMLGGVVWVFHDVVFGSVAVPLNEVLYAVARSYVSHDLIYRAFECAFIDWCACDCVHMRHTTIFARVTVNALATWVR